MNCHFCDRVLSLAKHFAYLVESQTIDNPAMLAAIRRMPHDRGRPLPACGQCDTAVPVRAVRQPVNRLHADRPAGPGLLWFSAVLLIGLALAGRDDG